MQDNLIIIRVDGGIASQISFVALGKAFEELGHKVKYDLGWFDSVAKGFYNTTNGYDKEYNLYFDIPKAFPSLPIEIASKEEVKHYEANYFIDDDNVITYQPPLYVGGYLGRRYDIYFSSLFASTFEPKEVHEEGSAFYDFLHEILHSQACGIHIRRGDLSQNHVVYGEPTSLAYFQQTIKLVRKIQPQSMFYLFSDDVAFAKEHIAPLIGDTNYKICDINTPEQGYLDLYLLSRCKIIIASHGSIGIYAKILSPHNPLLITPRTRNVFYEMENVMVVNWGLKMQATSPNMANLPPPPPQCSNLSLRNKIRLYIYRRLKSKLMRKGVIQ